jgi:hypothetical protein
MLHLEKHKHYHEAYRANDTYWGLGVEHETYLETSKLKQITPKELKEHREHERYSVHYYDVYDMTIWENTIDDLFGSEAKLLLPILVNSHTFQKTDLYGEHRYLTERIPKPNPKCQEMTLLEWMKQQNPDVFQEEWGKRYTFDGDSIEFTTQDFYKATVYSLMAELQMIEKDIIRALNSLPREGILKTYAPFQIASQNYPFVSYVTNLKNNAMFNNGTFHINITLPTVLNENTVILDKTAFIEQHRCFARVIQWISPLLVAVYGTPDPLSESKKYGNKYAAGSQRIAVSRYVGLGTYDTDLMEMGTILTRRREELTHLDWYESFYQYANYHPLQDVGMDLNFHKYDGHGLEIRFFDSVSISKLEDILVFLIHLADFSLQQITFSNPTREKTWHDIAERCVHLGKGYQMDVSVQYELYKIFGVHYLSKEPLFIEEVFQIIRNSIIDRFKQGLCVRCMIYGDPISGLINTKEERKEERKEEQKEAKQESIQIEEIELTNVAPQSPPAFIAVTEPDPPKSTGWCCC